MPGFPDGSVVKNLPANAEDTRDVGLILQSGRAPGEEKGKLLQYSCLGNPMDRKAWRAIVHGVTKKSNTTWQLNNSNNACQANPRVTVKISEKV